MLVHLWLDRIMLYSSFGQAILPLRGIDSLLPETLIRLYQKTQTDKVYVVTWPWSFTHMRVGILALQTLSLLIWSKLSLLQVDKISLYASLVDLGYIPSSVFMYIGQKKNLWFYDFRQSNGHSVVAMENFNPWVKDYAIDTFIADTVSLSIEQRASHEIGREWSDNGPNLTYCKKTIDCSDLFAPTEILQAPYLIEPTIG